jgi:hypothetical protein
MSPADNNTRAIDAMRRGPSPVTTPRRLQLRGDVCRWRGIDDRAAFDPASNACRAFVRACVSL